MPVFADTSALFAVADKEEERHSRAMSIWTRLHSENEGLVTSNYIVVESSALIARRLGLEAERDFHSIIVPVLLVVCIDAAVHRRAVTARLASDQRDLSLVDCVSFEVMKDLRIDKAFAFDRHFAQPGFQTALQAVVFLVARAYSGAEHFRTSHLSG